MKYRAVIFDLSGTLVDNWRTAEYEEILSNMAGILCAPTDDFVQLWRESFQERIVGRIATVEENVSQVFKKLKVSIQGHQVSAAAELLLDFQRRALIPRPDAIQTLKRLRTAGYKVGLISDCTAEVPLLWPETPFASLVDTPIFSCTVRLRKPDPRIYKLACEQLGVEPKDCLYVGDGLSDELSGVQRPACRGVGRAVSLHARGSPQAGLASMSIVS